LDSGSYFNFFDFESKYIIIKFNYNSDDINNGHRKRLIIKTNLSLFIMNVSILYMYFILCKVGFTSWCWEVCC
jgi:hypothetical protein